MFRERGFGRRSLGLVRAAALVVLGMLLFARAGRAYGARAASPGDAEKPAAGERRGNGGESSSLPGRAPVEILRFLRNDPGSVVPVDLAAMRLRSTFWDLRVGPAGTLRSIALVPPLIAGDEAGEAGADRQSWTVRQRVQDPLTAPPMAAPTGLAGGPREPHGPDSSFLNLGEAGSSLGDARSDSGDAGDPGRAAVAEARDLRRDGVPDHDRLLALPEAFGPGAPLGPAPAVHFLGETWVATVHEDEESGPMGEAGESGASRETGRSATVSAEVLGDGWALLPAGPVRCWLIGEALAITPPRDAHASGTRARGGSASIGGASSTRAYRYRWVSPRLGTVAVLRSEDGEAGPDFRRASLFERLAAFRPEAFPLRLYSDQFPGSTFQTLAWSYESGGAISGMTPEGYASAGQLVDDGGALPPTWQFTTPQDVSASVRATTQVPVAQSCYAACCGFSVAGNDFATRADNPANGGRGFTAVDRVTGATDRYFFRGIVAAEGDATSELRSCFDGGASHNTVLAYEFQHADGARFYMQKNDAWSNALKACSQDVWLGGNCSSCTAGTAGYVSRRAPQTGITATVVNEGVVTLPSGHHLDALLLRNTNDFTVYGDPVCLIVAVQTIHQYTYAWLVPALGNVATLSSDLNVTDPTSWTTGSTSLNFSLLPPVSITAGEAACDRVTLSWNPGTDASRITRYKVYWGTQSGGVAAYPFNSDANAGQVSFSGASATISGLAPGTTYYVTVTSLADHAAHTYESPVYPTQVTGSSPPSAYPAEVAAATATGPVRAASGLTVSKSGSGAMLDVSIAWSPLAGEPCVDRYAVFAAATPRPASPPGSFPNDPAFTDVSGLDTDGSSTNPSFTYTTDRSASAYYLVLASSSAGQLGPACSYPYPGPDPTCP